MPVNLRLAIAKRRFELGWSQAKLARVAQVDRCALNRWEQGHGDLNGDTIDRLLNALGGGRMVWEDPPTPHPALSRRA